MWKAQCPWRKFRITFPGLVDSVGGGGSSFVTFDDLGQWTNQIGAGEKLNPAAKRRIAAELPLVGRRDLMDFRLTFDVIFRY